MGDRLAGSIQRHRLNAALGWMTLLVITGVVIESLVTSDFLWAGFALLVGGLALIPVVKFRTPLAMLPWEVLALAALPILGRAIASVPEFGQIGMYLSVAALALILAIELHVFTPVRMSPKFAILFVVITTLAMAGVWAVVRWGADIVFGTGFTQTEHELMLEFVASTIAGIAAGIVFQEYFRGRVNIRRRLPFQHR